MNYNSWKNNPYILCLFSHCGNSYAARKSNFLKGLFGSLSGKQCYTEGSMLRDTKVVMHLIWHHSYNIATKRSASNIKIMASWQWIGVRLLTMCMLKYCRFLLEYMCAWIKNVSFLCYNCKERHSSKIVDIKMKW